MTPDQLAALHAECFETPRPWSAREFAELLAAPGSFLCTLPEGFVLGRVLLDECELLTIAVAPDNRRKGLGRALLDAFEAEARSRGAVSVFLEVSDANAPARALYESHGYRQAGTRKAYYRAPDGNRIDALVFSRDLT